MCSVLSEVFFFFSLFAFGCRVLTAVQNFYCDDYPLIMHHLVVIYSCIPTLSRLSNLSICYTLCMTSFKPPLFKCLSYFIFFLFLGFFVFFLKERKRGNLSSRACKIYVGFFFRVINSTPLMSGFTMLGHIVAESRKSLRNKLTLEKKNFLLNSCMLLFCLLSFSSLFCYFAVPTL